MLESLLIILFMLIITAFSSSEMDTIKYPNKNRTPLIDKKFFKKLLGKHYQKFRDNWYMANNWQGHTYFKKTIGAMFIDGWHWFKFWRILSFSIIIAIALILTFNINSLISISIYWSFLLGYIVTFIHGIFFEIFYQDILGI